MMNCNNYFDMTDQGDSFETWQGLRGPAGTTFTPSVSSAGVISWTNDGGKQNPPSVDIKGPQGPPGEPQTPSDAEPLMDGNPSAGSATTYARGDHRHPSDYNKAPVITDTASGAVASFPDGADGLPLHKLTVQIEPVQAGSGEPSPENIRLLYGWTGCTISKAKNNLLHITNASNTNSGVNFSKDASSGTVVLNGTPNGSQSPFGNLDYEPGQSKYPRGVPLRLSGAVEDVAIRVCYNTRASSATINLANCTTSNPDVVFSFPEEAYAMWIRVVAINNSREYVNVEVRPMVRVASDSDMTFSPFSGGSTNISWASEAGTIYGGTLNIEEGTLTAVLAGHVFDGTETFGHANNVIIWPSSPTAKMIGAGGVSRVNTLRCSHLAPALQYLSTAEQRVNAICPWVGNGKPQFIIGYVTGVSSDEEMIAYLQQQYAAGTPLTVVYELEQPVTYQLTLPAMQDFLKTLYGANNIWANTGDVSVEYRADTKLFIQKINTPTDNDMTADAQIASGKYFIVGGNLYLSTTTIPAGDTIIPGTNCTLTNLAEALNALNT